MEAQQLKDKIGSFIKTYTDKGNILPKDKKAVEADLSWEASRFWANIIHLSSPIQEKMTWSEFLDYKLEYEASKKVTIDVDGLFDKFWLRKVLGFVEVPGGISRLCSTFEKTLDFKTELKFIDHLYSSLPSDNKNIEKGEVETILAGYNKTYNTNVEIENIYQQNWFEIKNDIVYLNNFNYHYSPLLSYWDDFQFLFDLKNKYKERRKEPKITQSDFIVVYSKFSLLYPNIPLLESLLEQKVIRSESNSYYVNFWNIDIDYFDLNDKICGFYWEMLLNDSSFKSDKERVLCYLTKICYWEREPNPLKHCSENAKKRFLDTALNLIENEDDLNDIENEIKKVKIDSFHICGVYGVMPEIILDNSKLNNSDLFELYNCVSELEYKAQTTFIHDQRSRNWIFYLLGIVVENDIEAEFEDREVNDEEYPPIFHYKRIIKLLKTTEEKLSLLGMIISYIVYKKRDIIPYLLTDIDFISLSFQIIDKFTFLEDEKEILSNKLWVKCLQLALITIRSENDKNASSKLIFQIFRQINKHKYDTNNNHRIVIQKKDPDNRERQLLDFIEKSPLHNHSYYSGTSDNYLLPAIFDELAVLFIELEENNIYNNGVIKLPLIKLDGLSWLMRCSTYWRYNPQRPESGFNTKDISRNFYDIYISTIEINKIDKKEEITTPIWGENNERIKVIDWLCPIWFIYKNRKLNKFLDPDFIFENEDNYYNKQNHFTAEKLRSHISILLQIYKQLILPTIPYGLEKKTIHKIKRRIEEKILDVLEDNSQNKPKEGKIDIFDFHQEWGVMPSAEKALLPQVAQATNYFENKEALMDVIIKTNDIVKILACAECITSKGIKQKLIDKVKEVDINSSLQGFKSIAEIQTTLSKLTQYPELISQIEAVVNIWEKEVMSKRVENYEYKKVLYQTQLLLAYFKEDESELNRIQVPSNEGAVFVEDISNNEIKDFFRALIRLKNNPLDSYNIFNTLIKRHPTNVNFALNRMAAKMSMAKREKNIDYYNEALEEWEEYKNTQDNIDESNLGSIFIANKMIIYFETQQYANLNNMYSSLDMLDQMNIEILKINIEALEVQGKLVEADALQKQAKEFHKSTLSDDLEDIDKLSIESDKIIAELKVHYHSIFDSMPDKLIKIFPEALNGKIIVNEFITREFAIAASKMLDKIMSIDKIVGEDKYNDIIELAIDSRINPWRWHVGAQSRGGFSNPKDRTVPKNPGERDLPIMDANKNPFCICEAFIYRDKSSAIDHVQKIFNYYHQHKNLIILIYNLEDDKFSENWDKYITEIVPKSTYPAGREYISKEDVTDCFGYENSAIKIAQSRHSNNITMHHIFVNIDWRTKVK